MRFFKKYLIMSIFRQTISICSLKGKNKKKKKKKIQFCLKMEEFIYETLLLSNRLMTELKKWIELTDG